MINYKLGNLIAPHLEVSVKVTTSRWIQQKSYSIFNKKYAWSRFPQYCSTKSRECSRVKINKEKHKRLQLLNRRQRPQLGRFISWRWQEWKVRWMPTAWDNFISVLSDNDGWEWHRQVALQICQHQLVIITRW